MLLNDGLEIISGCCFGKSGLEEVTIPGSVRVIDYNAFFETPLRCARFLGAAAREQHHDFSLRSGCSFSGTEKGRQRSEQRMIIGDRTFAGCKSLK